MATRGLDNRTIPQKNIQCQRPVGPRAGRRDLARRPEFADPCFRETWFRGYLSLLLLVLTYRYDGMSSAHTATLEFHMPRWPVICVEALL